LSPLRSQNPRTEETREPQSFTRKEYLAALQEQPQRTQRGTGEWAAETHNIGKGCSHRCLYCYAREGAVRRHQVSSPEAWACEQLRATMPRIPRRDGWIMFPSTHDITPFYLPAALITLKALLEKGNKVLIVTKPHLQCIAQLCEELAIYKERILFRFTIGTLDESLAKFWEPGAPTPTERASCLQYAFNDGFQTSVSMEPMLAGTEDAVRTFHALVPWVTDKIWLGKMNKVNRRVARTTQEIAQACQRIQQLQSDEAILDLVHQLGDHPQVAWKDSIQDVISACGAKGNCIKNS
jgi:DNA repair photolyase